MNPGLCMTINQGYMDIYYESWIMHDYQPRINGYIVWILDYACILTRDIWTYIMNPGLRTHINLGYMDWIYTMNSGRCIYINQGYMDIYYESLIMHVYQPGIH